MNIFHLALIRFKKTIRQPFTLILITFNFVIVALSAALPFFTFQKTLELKMFLDIAIASTFIVSSVITIYFASTAISEEINDRTIFVLFSKTVSKKAYLAGNFLGLLLVSIILYTFTYILSDFAYSYNHFNLFYSYPDKIGLFDYIVVYICDLFGMGVDFSSEYGITIKERYINSMTFSLFPFIFKFFFVSFLNSLFMISIAVALSPFLPFAINLTGCLVIFCLGNLATQFAEHLPVIGHILYSILPNMDLFNSSDAIALDIDFGLLHLFKLFCYSIAYSCFIIFISSKFLEHKEFI